MSIPWRDLSIKNLQDTKDEFAEDGYVMQWYAMAGEIILTTLGPDWWKKYLVNPTKPQSDYFKALGITENDRYSHQNMVVRLGHWLYKLKDVKGYKEYLIETLKRIDIGPALFELEVGGLIVENGYNMEFVQRQMQKKGNDYDIIAYLNGRLCAIEVKTRRKNKILDEKILKNALEDARKQLPKNNPCIIFVQIPLEWTTVSNAKPIINGIVKKFFLNTKRVNMIVLLWEEWRNLDYGGKAFISRVYHYSNPSPRNPLNTEVNFKKKDNSGFFSPSFYNQ